MKPKIIIASAATLVVTATAIYFSSDGFYHTEKNTQQKRSKPLNDITITNQTAYISSQCYTKTDNGDGKTFNPCYSCHINGVRPNYLDDSDLQQQYSFPQPALKNPFINLFEDRSAAVASISDQEILDYIAVDNYFNSDGRIPIADKLRNLPADWDSNGNGKWDGYIPDAYYAFDFYGFDRANDSSYSGWRAFAYYPFLGTFWPTNGSTDDVLIRLPQAFQEDSYGNFDLATYKVNLAIVESLVRRQDVTIEAIDEGRFGVDLDKNGRLSTANLIRYDWAPIENRSMTYVGRAKSLLEQGEIHLAAGLFPEGTEFLHSVRYIVPQTDGSVALSARMKELRYAKKKSWYNFSELKGNAEREMRERAIKPDAVRRVPGDYERGMFAQGWVYQGFIEDKNGELRPQSQEETLFCMGCHGGIGATTDTIFSFTRKFDHGEFQQGWYHWSQKGMVGVNEPKRRDGSYEYSHYLEQNSAGDEFRENQEIINRFFDESGQLKADMTARLHDDISVLLFPSKQRALSLNKAYRSIVMEQDFINGRDATITPSENIHRQVEQNQSTGIKNPVKQASL